MIMIPELTDEQLDYLIEKIPCQSIRRYFQSNPREFSKLKNGFRPESVTDEMAVALAKKNKKKDYIISLIRKQVDLWDSEISGYMKKLEDNGFSHDAALFRTIPLSIYDKNIDLFFKIRGEGYSADEIEKIKNAIKTYGSSVNLEEIGEAPTFSESEYDALLSENNALKDDLAAKEDFIREQNEKIDAIQNKLDELEYVEEFSDAPTEQLVVDEEYPYLSICKVYIDQYTEKRWLTRIADIEENDVKKFSPNEDMPALFENRDRLFWRNGPDKADVIGVWKWNVVPNRNDPNTDYVQTAFCEKVNVIEVIEIDDASSINEIISLAKKGIQHSSDGNKLFLAYRDADDFYNGILLKDRDLDYENGIIKIKIEIFAVPQYRISDEECIHVGGRIIFKHIAMGKPMSVCKTKDPNELIKEILIERASISVLRQKGLSRKEAQSYQLILKEMAGESLYREYAEKYNCSEKEAEEYVNAFVQEADKYLSGSDLDTDILSEAILRNDELVNKCKDLLEDEWKSENEERIKDAKKTLETIEKEIKRRNEEIKETEENYSKYKEELSNREKLASNIEDRITQKIKNTQSLLGELLADATIYDPIFSAIRGASENRSLSTDTQDEEKLIIYDNALEEHDDSDAIEIIDDIDTFKDELADIFISAGYKRDGAIELALAVVFCMEQKIPFLCQSNGELIANCVASMFGKNKATNISIPVGYTNGKNVRKLIVNNSNRNAFYINGMFDGFSMNLFNAMMANKDEWPNNTFIVLSIEGVKPYVLSEAILDHAFYINSDIDYQGDCTDSKPIYNSKCHFTKLKLTKEIKERYKALKKYDSIVSNYGIFQYSAYMEETNEEFEGCWMVWSQLALRSMITGKTEEFREYKDSLDLTEECKRHLIGIIGNS